MTEKARADTDHHFRKDNDKVHNDVKQEFMLHPDVNSKNLFEELDSKNVNTRVTAVEHLDKAINDKNEFARESAVGHPTATDDHIRQRMKDKNREIARLSNEIAKEI